MRTTDYLINAVFLLIVFRQARERELDLRSAIVPLLIVAYVAHLYVHSLPTTGNDLLLIAGIGSRMVFAFVISHGAHHAIATFSSTHPAQRSAWPVALVLMALLEVSLRIGIVQLRGRPAMLSGVGALPLAT